MKRFLMMMTVVGVATMMAASSFAQAAGQRQGGQQGGQRQGQGGGQRQGGMGMGMRNNPEMQKKVEAAQTKVMKSVGLTADQQTKVKAANKKMQDAMQKEMQSMMAARDKGQQPDRTKMQAAFKKINDTHTADLTKIMGKAKYDQYTKLMQAEMQKLRQEMGGQRGGQGGQRQGGQRQGGGQRTTGGGI